ncbi:hypothetical protein GDO78_005871 [Eleutherodactylus coqui]|uniref:Uncharacterized protein n=1 Tax=Eleutherodactylus coqui TaxID=57060 RepID=A0A8J6FMR5_ELECQ|nr:hypothetical protein GDO78_005871 [Eleutherodactylus coqui]
MMMNTSSHVLQCCVTDTSKLNECVCSDFVYFFFHFVLFSHDYFRVVLQYFSSRVNGTTQYYETGSSNSAMFQFISKRFKIVFFFYS